MRFWLCGPHSRFCDQICKSNPLKLAYDECVNASSVYPVSPKRSEMLKAFLDFEHERFVTNVNIREFSWINKIHCVANWEIRDGALSTLALPCWKNPWRLDDFYVGWTTCLACIKIIGREKRYRLSCKHAFYWMFTTGFYWYHEMIMPINTMSDSLCGVWPFTAEKEFGVHRLQREFSLQPNAIAS